MGEKDITEKLLEDYNDVFTDIINVLLFNGETIVKENELTNSKIYSQYRDSEYTLREMERDVSKFWENSNIRIALFGIENQTYPEKYMPLRIFGYEGASYREQLDNKNVYPVITLVLYFGTTRHWSYKRSLKEILLIPEGLDNFVNDVKINLFEIAWLPDEVIEKFTSDFKIVARFFKEKRINKEYIPRDKTIFKHVDEILKLLSVMTGDNRYEHILNSCDREDVKNMCDVADRLENKGKAELIINMLNIGKTPEQIAEFCNIDLTFIREIEEKYKV